MQLIEVRPSLELRTIELGVAPDVSDTKVSLATKLGPLALVISAEEGALRDLDPQEIEAAKAAAFGVENFIHVEFLKAGVVRKRR